MKLIVETLSDVGGCAQKITDAIPNKGVVLVHGEMGAGKTTLIKHLCAAMGVVDEVNSPTYALVNEYRTAIGDIIYHFDLYRLESAEEALDIGIEEYFDSGALCFVEWPDRLEYLTPEAGINIHIALVNNRREIVVENFG